MLANQNTELALCAYHNNSYGSYWAVASFAIKCKATIWFLTRNFNFSNAGGRTLPLFHYAFEFLCFSEAKLLVVTIATTAISQQA